MVNKETTPSDETIAEWAARGRAVKRRRVLAAVGVAGAGALAGCTGSDDDGGNDNQTDDDSTPADDQTMTPQPQQQVDPRFGYTVTSEDETPPTEPDHTVELLIQEREGGPETPEFFFEPTGLFVEPGDTVKFNLASPHHNVNAFHPAFGYEQRLPDSVPAFSSPVLTAGDYWLYTFEEEGVHDMVCAPHEVFGMVGRIVVGSATGPGANPVGEAPGGARARAPPLTAGLVLSDDAMAPDNIAAQGSVSWSEIAAESKRILIQPVEEDGAGSGE